MAEPLFDFEISGAELRRAAKWLDRLALGRVQTGQEYLSGVLVRADSATLSVTLSATDLAVYGVSISECKVRADGQVVISARLLSEIAKTCRKDESLHVVNDSGVVVIDSQSAQWRLPTISPQYWPLFRMRGELLAECSTTDFATALARVMPAVDKEKIRPTWGGVALSVTPGRITVVAAGTGAYRMAVAYVPAETSATSDEPVQLVVPGECLTDALAGAEGSPVLALASAEGSTENGCVLSGKTFRARTRVLDEYVMWWNALPDNMREGSFTHSRVVLGVKEAQAAIARIGFLTGDKTPLRMDIAEDEVTFSPVQDEGGKGHGFAACGAEVSEDYHESVVFTAGYLGDILTGVASPSVELLFSLRASHPVLAYPLSGEGERMTDYLHVIRPIDMSRRRR